MSGQTISTKGIMPNDREQKSSPRPSILVELFCNKDLVVIYLLSMLMKPRGIRAGIPPQNSMHMMITK